ncbi:MAG: MBL fold metallo-hydrolase [Magnetococcales bacterium]|nr:MBL fold metallo-hydrolase [Magnetococcales bacterium]
MSKGAVVHITSEVSQVGGSDLTAAEDAAIYLIHCAGGVVLVDAGTGLAMERLLANIRAAGVAPEQISHLLLTHCHFDHTGGAHALRQRLQCRTVMHQQDACFLERGDAVVTAANWYRQRMIPCPIDEPINGSRWNLELGSCQIMAHHVPGHSPGSLVFTMESDHLRIMFAQDVHGPLHPSLNSNRSDYQNSLQRMLDLNCDVLCEGHYGIIKGKKESAAFIRSFMTVS